MMSTPSLVERSRRAQWLIGVAADDGLWTPMPLFHVKRPAFGVIADALAAVAAIAPGLLAVGLLRPRSKPHHRGHRVAPGSMAALSAADDGRSAPPTRSASCSGVRCQMPRAGVCGSASGCAVSKQYADRGGTAVRWCRRTPEACRAKTARRCRQAQHLVHEPSPGDGRRRPRRWRLVPPGIVCRPRRPHVMSTATGTGRRRRRKQWGGEGGVEGGGGGETVVPHRHVGASTSDGIPLPRRRKAITSPPRRERVEPGGRGALLFTGGRRGRRARGARVTRETTSKATWSSTLEPCCRKALRAWSEERLRFSAVPRCSSPGAPRMRWDACSSMSCGRRRHGTRGTGR